MSTAILTSKGLVTLPKDVRTRLGIGTGDRVEFVEIQAGVFQIFAATHDVCMLKGIVAKPIKPVSIDDMNRALVELGDSQ